MNSPMIELFKLIKDHIHDILLMESSNQSHIYLYRTDVYWVAFERSAFNRCHAYVNSITTPMKILNISFPIVMASVNNKDILTATHNLYCLKHTKKLRIYDAKSLSYNNTAFNKWHNKKIECFDTLLL